MNSIYFNEDHEKLRASIRKFMEIEMIPFEEKWEEEGIFPREIFTKMGELGFLGIKFPQEYGGLALDYFSNIVFLEELSRTAGGAALSILAHTDISATILNLLGNHEQKQKYLSPSISGEMIGALGITEADHGSDVAGIEAKAIKDGDSYILNGSKMYITNGTRADYVILAAKTNPNAGYKGISLFILDTKLPGYKISKKLNKLGNRASDTAELYFEDVRIPAENVLGEENKGFYNIMHNFQGERLAAAIGGYAVAEKVWEDTMKYCNQRKVFGQSVSKFQVNSHKLVDMMTEIEAGKQLTHHAAWLYSQGKDCVKEVSMAKLYCTEMCFKVLNQAIQLHGGVAYMMEYSVQRFWRDARLTTIGAGTSEVMKEIIGKRLGL